MTISEFKAWLEGFEAALNGPPTEDQWATIKAKIAQLREVHIDPLPSGYKWRDPVKPSPWWETTNLGAPTTTPRGHAAQRRTPCFAEPCLRLLPPLRSPRP